MTIPEPSMPRAALAVKHRWQQWLTPAKTFAACSLWAGSLQAILLFVGETPRAARAPLATVVVALLVAAQQAWRSPRGGRIASTAALLLASLVCWMTVLGAISRHSQLLAFGTLLATALAALLGGLTWSGLAASKALMLCASLGLALFAAEVTLEVSRQMQAARIETPATAGDRAVRALQRQPQPQVPVPDREFPFPIDEWVRGRSWPDDDLLYILEPHGLFKQYYPDNPRGYFYEESDAEWAMRQHWGTPGDRSYFLTPLDDRDASVRVHFRTPYRPREYHPQVSWGQFPVRAGQRLVATLRCRSDRPRYLNALWIGSSAPWPRVAPETGFNIGSEWQEVSAEATIEQDHDRAALLLVIPPDDPPVEIAVLQLTVDGQPVSPRPVPNLYRSYVAYALNSRGHRDREYEVPRPENVFRIVCLGDSFTFGQGVHAQDTVSSVLAARLNEQTEAAGQFTRYEAVNCGASGYSTHEERMSYERQGRAYQPQVAVVLMVLNDDVNSRDEQTQLAAAQQGLEVVRALRNAAGAGTRRDFSKSLAELRELNKACQADGAKLVVAVFRHEPIVAGGDWDRLIKTVQPGLAEDQIPYVDLGDAIVAKASFDDLRVYPGGDPHPSAVAHAAAAEALEKYLRAQRLIPLPP